MAAQGAVTLWGPLASGVESVGHGSEAMAGVCVWGGETIETVVAAQDRVNEPWDIRQTGGALGCEPCTGS